MGSMRIKRRKKLKKSWAEFQAEYNLSDEDSSLARSTGIPVAKFKEKVSRAESEGLTPQQVIRQLHESHQQRLSKRRAAIADGTLQPKKKSKKPKKTKHDPAWVKAKKLCRLNQEDIRKAKELGLTPKTLMKNNPAPTQQWKLPVKEWIRELYECKLEKKRQQST